MRTGIVKIGNSRGILIPKALLDQTGLQGEVEIKAQGESLVVVANSKSIPNAFSISIRVFRLLFLFLVKMGDSCMQPPKNLKKFPPHGGRGFRIQKHRTQNPE